MSTFATPPAGDLETLIALLGWYSDVGVDLALGDDAVDRFAQTVQEKAIRVERAAPAPAVPPRALQHPATPPPRPAPAATIPNADTVMAARALAEKSPDLDSLRQLLVGFDGCNLKLTAKNLVFSDGNPTSKLMFVGEAPGRDEDIEGKPFVGKSGKLLDRMLAAAGLSRENDAYIANVVYWRPPGNREPSDQEIAICKPFILRQIELVNPDVLVFLGGQPTKALLGADAAKSGIRKLRGRWVDFEINGKTYKALPTYHPAYLLRNPIEKRLAWRDLLAALEVLRAKA